MGTTLDSEKRHQYMLETPIPQLVTSLAVPTAVSQLITVIYNTADTFFVSHISTSASAAVGVVFSLMAIIQAVGFGIGMGSNSLISRNLGAKKDEAANQYASSAVFMAFCFGCLLAVIGLWQLQPLMCLLGSTDSMLSDACSYARLILIAAPVMCMSFVLNNILKAEGEAVFSMWALCIGGFLNMILDPLFIFGCHMGIAGAALATAISQLMSFSFLMSIFVRNKTIIHLHPRGLSTDYQCYLDIVRIGFPTICRQGLASIAAALLNIKASMYGDSAIAAITIANKIYMLVRNIVVGIGQGFQPVAGYNYGAGDKERVREAFRFVCMAGTVFCLICAVPIGIWAEEVMCWFRDDTQVIMMGTPALRYACLVMPLMAYSTYVNQTIQCLGYSVPAAFLASCRQGIFFIPLIVLLSSRFGLQGIQMTQPVADGCTFLISIIFQIRFFRKHLNQ